MAHLSQFKQQEILKLLNQDKIDVSNGALLGNAGRLTPDSTNRTIIIGIGGTGVSTVNKIKGVINKRLNATWENYVAFLAIDTDWEELRQAKNLNELEKFMYTQDGATRRYQNRGTYPKAAHQFMPDGFPNPNDALNLGNLNARGANRERLVGRAKLHDKASGAPMGVDEMLVSRLSRIAAELQLGGGHGHYEVYVVGSSCGGTCSGAFSDMPALIREAIPNANVYSMLFLPDTLSGTIPASAHPKLQANGFATLKELNYYQAVEMRGEDYPMRWGYNSPAKPELVINQKYFNIPYLVGSPDGSSAATANQGARQTVAEFLVSLLARVQSADANGMFLTDSFLANADTKDAWDNRPVNDLDNTKEAKNTYHNFPKSFSAVGFAKATAPEDLIRAYQASIVCERAGICPTKDKKEWELQPADKKTFRSLENIMIYAEAEAEIAQILQPLDSLLDEIHANLFDYRSLPGKSDMTFEDAKRDAPDGLIDAAVSNLTTLEAQRELKNKIDEAYERYEENVRQFVKKEGPYAFNNLYRGFYPDNGNHAAVGIGTRLANLAAGRTMTGEPYTWTTVEAAREKVAAARSELKRADRGLIPGLIDKIVGGKQDRAKASWVQANTELGNSMVITKRRELCLKDTGYFQTSFITRAARMNENLRSFGDLLVALSDIYGKHGENMSTYPKFRSFNRDETVVNAAAISNVSYDWLKQKVVESLATLKAREFRYSLVDHFFGKDDKGVRNWDKWLDVPDNLIARENNQIKLATEDGAIPARELFDELVAAAIPSTVSVSIQDLFKMLNDQNIPYDTVANDIIQNLLIKSRPRFHADLSKVSGTQTHRYIMYPAALSGQAGQQIEEALRNAALAVDPGISCYASDDADGIMFYQQEIGLEMNMLADIENWEREYEVEVAKANNLLHGKSPDTRQVLRDGKVAYYKETISWKDYPSLVGKDNPEEPDPITHQISREGQLRIKLRKIVEEAKKLGVLYSEQDAAGQWRIFRVWCDYRTPKWDLNFARLPQDAQGMFPLGRDLAEAVAYQNGRTLGYDSNTMSRVVQLQHAGLLSQAHADEADAWEFAIRSLRDNVQMYVEVLDTLELFRGWGEQINKFNEEIGKKLRPAKVAYLMKAGVVYCKGDGQWIMKDENGRDQLVANLSAQMLAFNINGERQMIDNKLLYYYLYNTIDSMLPGEELNKACRFALKEMTEMARNQDMDSLTAGQEKVNAIIEERKFQIDMGAQMEEKKEPLQKYVNFLMDIGLTRNDAKLIETFYSRVAAVQNLTAQNFK